MFLEKNHEEGNDIYDWLIYQLSLVCHWLYSRTYNVTEFLIKTSYCYIISRNHHFNLNYRPCFVLAVLHIISRKISVRTLKNGGFFFTAGPRHRGKSSFLLKRVWFMRYKRGAAVASKRTMGPLSFQNLSSYNINNQ